MVNKQMGLATGTYRRRAVDVTFTLRATFVRYISQESHLRPFIC